MRAQFNLAHAQTILRKKYLNSKLRHVAHARHKKHYMCWSPRRMHQRFQVKKPDFTYSTLCACATPKLVNVCISSWDAQRIRDSEFSLLIFRFLRMRGPKITARSIKAIPRAIVYANYPLNLGISTEQQINPPQPLKSTIGYGIRWFSPRPARVLTTKEIQR